MLVSTYYDTPAGSLTRGSISLRRRQEQASSSWRLELPTDEGRIELEEDGPADVVPAEFLSLLVAHLHRRRLVPVATLRTHRAEVVSTAGEGRVRVAHDRVEVIDGVPGVVDFARIRVELPHGTVARGRRDRRAPRRGRGAAAAADRARRSFPAWPCPSRASRARGSPNSSTTSCPTIPGTRLGVDPEHLHAHRVAIRRLRGALREEPLKSELGWIGGALGAVRDLDVLTERLRHEAALLDGDERAALRPVLARLARRRARARRELIEALGSPRYFALLDALEEVAAAKFESSRDLTELAGDEFRRLRRESRAQGPSRPTRCCTSCASARSASATPRSAPARPGRPRSARSSSEAKALQDVLGAHQDAVVMENELRELVGETATPIRAIAIGRLIERERALRESSVAEWPAAWKRLEKEGKKAFPRARRRKPRAPKPEGDPAPASSTDAEPPT